MSLAGEVFVGAMDVIVMGDDIVVVVVIVGGIVGIIEIVGGVEVENKVVVDKELFVRGKV